MIPENDISARSQALGEVIAKRLPELVGVQEMFRFECYDLGQPSDNAGCNDPRVLDRDVILARGDIAEHVAPLNPALLVANLCPGRVSEDGCNYDFAKTRASSSFRGPRPVLPKRPRPLGLACQSSKRS
jgi:hypothetical protein